MTTSVPAIAPALRRLYLVRFAFAVVWAVSLLLSGSSGLTPVAVVLLVLYPVFDVVAAVVDVRASGRAELYLNIAVSALAAVGLGVAAAGGVPAVVRVWGVWAAVAGGVQLVVALRRRRLGGQWPMIVSGGLSVVVGVLFLVSAAGTGLSSLAFYALLGGVLFLVSALRLHP